MADASRENGVDSPAPAGLTPVRGLDSAEDVVMQWDSASSEHARQSMIWDCPRDEAVAYLEAVDEIHSALESLSVSQSNTRELSRAQNLRQLAMARLEEEFRHLLLAYSDSIDPEWLLENCSRAGSFSSRRLDDATADDAVEAARSSDEEEGAEYEASFSRPVGEMKPLVDLIPPAVVPDLSDIAQRMLAAGYKRECVQVYASIRKNALEETLKRLGVERLSIDEVGRMRWEDLEVKIKKWNQSMKVSLRALFASEKRLCDDVFASAPEKVGATCFNELGKGPMMQLLSFGEAVAISRRSPEKLFKILDMYETLRDLLPEIEEIFCGEACAPLRAEAAGILMRLGECARGTFADFESAIQRDGSKTPVPGGGVHPLTRYVMNYIKFMCDYSDTLKLLFGEKEADLPDAEEVHNSLKDSPRYSSRSDGDDGSGRNATTELSPLAVQTIWITKVLLSNLEEKSKLYKDLSLTYLFLMNNIHYIVQKVKSTEVRALVGDDWVRKNTSQVRQYASSYQRAAWGKVLSCLRDEGIHTSGSFSSGVSKQVLKERFKSFNLAFDEVYKAQMSWVVFDEPLRDELRISISDKILPAYRSFLGRYGHYLETQRHPERYIKYTSDDIEEYLNNLFEGYMFSQSSKDLRRRGSNHGSSHHGT
jgi:exocyst complex protein 7